MGRRVHIFNQSEEDFEGLRLPREPQVLVDRQHRLHVRVEMRLPRNLLVPHIPDHREQRLLVLILLQRGRGLARRDLLLHIRQLIIRAPLLPLIPGLPSQQQMILIIALLLHPLLLRLLLHQRQLRPPIVLRDPQVVIRGRTLEAQLPHSSLSH